MSRAALARCLLVAALLPSAGLADAPCLPLGGQIAFCPATAEWEGAFAVPISGEPGGRMVEAPPLVLEASRNIVDRTEYATPDAALAMIESMLAQEALEDGDPAPTRRLRDVIVTDHATVALDLYIEVMDGAEYPLAILLTEDDTDWLTLILMADGPIEVDTFEQSARDLAAALRPATEE